MQLDEFCTYVVQYGRIFSGTSFHRTGVIGNGREETEVKWTLLKQGLLFRASTITTDEALANSSSNL